jgi:hypothetical protein
MGVTSATAAPVKIGLLIFLSSEIWYKEKTDRQKNGQFTSTFHLIAPHPLLDDSHTIVDRMPRTRFLGKTVPSASFPFDNLRLCPTHPIATLDRRDLYRFY